MQKRIQGNKKWMSLSWEIFCFTYIEWILTENQIIYNYDSKAQTCRKVSELLECKRQGLEKVTGRQTQPSRFSSRSNIFSILPTIVIQLFDISAELLSDLFRWKNMKKYRMTNATKHIFQQLQHFMKSFQNANHAMKYNFLSFLHNIFSIFFRWKSLSYGQDPTHESS